MVRPFDRDRYCTARGASTRNRAHAELADEGKGKLRPHVSALYLLDRAVEAQQKSREGHIHGKAVLVL